MIKPYYEQDGITIYNCDCRLILPELPKVDLVLTDPPYGLGHKLHDGGTWGTNPIYDAMLDWDLCPVDNNLLLSILPLGVSAIVWGGNYFTLPVSRCWLSWEKTEKMPTLADMELAWTNLDKPSKQFTQRRNKDGKRQHPTQKPVSLMSWCIRMAGQPQSIIDPFLGSGTSLLAAKILHISAIGIEIEEKYCEIAAKRLGQGVLPL